MRKAECGRAKTRAEGFEFGFRMESPAPPSAALWAECGIAKGRVKVASMIILSGGAQLFGVSVWVSVQILTKRDRLGVGGGSVGFVSLHLRFVSTVSGSCQGIGSWVIRRLMTAVTAIGEADRTLSPDDRRTTLDGRPGVARAGVRHCSRSNSPKRRCKSFELNCFHPKQ